MSSLRKKALIRLLLCAVMLIATIVFSVLLLTGTFDGAPESTDPAATAQSGETTTDPNAASDPNAAGDPNAASDPKYNGRTGHRTHAGTDARTDAGAHPGTDARQL